MRTFVRKKFGSKFSEGARLLWIACIRNGWDQQDLRRLLECPAGCVGRYLWGDRRPDRDTGNRIFDVAGVRPTTWDEEPKKAFVPPTILKSKKAA